MGIIPENTYLCGIKSLLLCFWEITYHSPEDFPLGIFFSLQISPR